MSLNRLEEFQACANVSAVRSSAALSEPVWRWNHDRTHAA
jgi:hypothetical protein